MNGYFLAAALLAFLVGLIHSVMGERLIFQPLRRDSRVPVAGEEVLRESHVRILWATWHIVTLLGWAVAAILVRLSQPGFDERGIAGIVALATAGSAALVFIGTRGRHPGWAGLLGVSALTLLGLYQ